MQTYKKTTISGRKWGYIPPTAPHGSPERLRQVHAMGHTFYYSTRAGHWSPEKADAAARRVGVVGDVEVTHYRVDVLDRRIGYDRAFIVRENGDIVDRPLTFNERAYSHGYGA